MKNSIKTLFESCIEDNKHFIKSYTEDGNIYDYFAGNIEQDQNIMLWFMNDEEIEFCENHSTGECSHIYEKIWDFLAEYNCSIDYFLGENVEPAYE